jgi:hypothetical protein
MKWLQFILSHSIFVAICAVALSFQTVLLLQLNNDPYVYGFIFFATLCSYNFYWILSKYSFHHDKALTVFLQKEITGIALLILSAAGLIICFLRGSMPLVNVLVAAALTVIYAIPLLPIKFLYFTRKAGFLKTTLLAFTWSYVTVVLPLQKEFFEINSFEVFIFSRRFLFMLMLCILFDNRDSAVDKIRGLRSLATDLSAKTLQRVIFVIFLILFATNFLSRQYGIRLAQSIALQISTIALLVTYFYSTRKQGYTFYYFFVDGMMLFSAIVTYVAGLLD